MINGLKVIKHTRTYVDLLDMLVRMGGTVKIFMMIFSILTNEFNEESYLFKMYKYVI